MLAPFCSHGVRCAWNRTLFRSVFHLPPSRCLDLRPLAGPSSGLAAVCAEKSGRSAGTVKLLRRHIESTKRFFSSYFIFHSARAVTLETSSCSLVIRGLHTGKMSSDDDDYGPPPKKGSASPKKAPGGAKGKAIEKIYQKKTQLEHILLRPDTYIGSVEAVSQEMWVYDTALKKMVYREIKYVPGLYKIFDEILVNAADNKQRDPKMSIIKVDINAEKNQISVWNNGHGIPVVEHKDEKMYVPTMIFGHLLTSSNYDDDEKKVTGGRNGYGAKLCNIFSNRFVVETASKEYKKKFRQEWTKNMTAFIEPKLEAFSGGEEFTRVMFEPDLRKFKMDTLEKDIVDLMSRRAYDIAGTSGGVKVYLNGEKLPVTNFRSYVELYTADTTDELGKPLNVISEKCSDRWEVAVTTSDTGFNQISFVNSIATTKGGRHVDYISEQLTKALGEVIKRKNKSGAEIKNFQIKNHLWVFVNCLIENPTFDSQTKENMTLAMKSFGSKCQLSDKFVSNVMKCGVVENILAFAKAKAESQMGKKIHGTKTSKLRGIPKLEDANDAGTRNSADCTLILTEGDSAKALAVSGFSVVGRDKYGVFPLRGKLLNVREATHKQLMENAEINNVVKILGLQFKRKYDTEQDLKSLRYGRLMIMTDQDQDGSHIKGLLINFIQFNWPSLLRHKFLEEFITPIVKALKGKEEEKFYSLPEFEEWKTRTPDYHKWKVKYYKGLGTSTSKEAKEYFSDMLRHRIEFRHAGPADDEAIELAFAKERADQRKQWLTSGMNKRRENRANGLGEMYLYGKNTRSVTYKQFVDEELILFSNMDNERSIPSLVDGLKPGHRKVLFTCFKRNDKREIKVAQLAGSVAEHSAYHHGEQSLMSTIVGLAQNFVGSNNINLLMPYGQFGTRLQGGKDSASPRYIFTMLSPLARAIFHQHDMPLLNYQREDNQKIEPDWYVPVVPMVLINGAEGIGTGWMTKIPNYNPREIVANLRRLILMEEPLPMGYRGEVMAIDAVRYVTNGEVAIMDDDCSIEISELPIRVWTQSYKESVIEPLLLGTEKDGKGKPPQILDYKEYHTDTTVRFVVKMARDKFEEFRQEGFHKVFKLQQSISMSSMVLFDSNGIIRKYDSVAEILREFFDVRIKRYSMRKEYLDALLSAEALKLQNMARFILEKIAGKIKVENIKRKAIIEQLILGKYDSDPVKAWKNSSDKSVDEEEPVTDETEPKKVVVKSNEPDYEYLMGMALWSLTEERKEELLKKRDAKEEELAVLRRKSPADLYNEDLDEFLKRLDDSEAAEKEADALPSSALKKPKGRGRGAVANKADTKPSDNATRVPPVVDVATLQKYEKMKEQKERKAAGEPAKKGRAKKGVESGEGDSESPTSGKEVKAKAAPKTDMKDGKKLKQTTLDTAVSKKRPTKKKGSDDESSFDSADLSEDDEESIVLDDDDDDEDFVKPVVLPKKVRGAATRPIDVDGDDSELSEPPKKAAKVVGGNEAGKEAVDEPTVPVANGKPTAKAEVKALVDEKKTLSTKRAVMLLSSDDDEDEYRPSKKIVSKKPSKDDKPAIKVKVANIKKARDTSEEIVASTSAKPEPAKRAKVDKKKAYQFSDSEDEVIQPRQRTARAAAAKTYAIQDSSAENVSDGIDYLETIN